MAASREYLKKWRAANKDKVNSYNRRYRANRPEHYNRRDAESKRRRMRERRKELIDLLGGECQYRLSKGCGRGDVRTLQFHHHHQDGADHRRKMGTKRGYLAAYYKELADVERRSPGSIRLACANCHAIIHYVPDPPPRKS